MKSADVQALAAILATKAQALESYVTDATRASQVDAAGIHTFYGVADAVYADITQALALVELGLNKVKTVTAKTV